MALHRRCFLLAVCTLGCSVLAAAQARGFTVDMTSTPDKYGFYDLVLSNTSSMNITAVRIFHECPATEEESASTHTSGFDAYLTFRLDKRIQIHTLTPGANRHFDILAATSHCRHSIAVMFSDGHGEALGDDLNSWEAIAAARADTYKELIVMQSIVAKMSSAGPEFTKSLLENLDERRVALTSWKSNGMTREEADTRMSTLDQVLIHLRVPGQIPVQFTEKAAMLHAIETWVEPLADALMTQERSTKPIK